MKWIKIISQFIFFVGVIFLLAFTNTQNSDRICIDYRINIDNETTSLVTRSEIIKLMESIKESIVGTNVNKVPIYEPKNYNEFISATNNINTMFYTNESSYTSRILDIRSTRAANSAYNFILCYSSGGSDI